MKPEELRASEEAYASQDLFDEWWWFDSSGNPIRRVSFEEWKIIQNTQENVWTREMVIRTAKQEIVEIPKDSSQDSLDTLKE